MHGHTEPDEYVLALYTYMEHRFCTLPNHELSASDYKESSVREHRRCCKLDRTLLTKAVEQRSEVKLTTLTSSHG